MPFKTTAISSLTKQESTRVKCIVRTQGRGFSKAATALDHILHSQENLELKCGVIKLSHKVASSQGDLRCSLTNCDLEGKSPCEKVKNTSARFLWQSAGTEASITACLREERVAINILVSYLIHARNPIIHIVLQTRAWIQTGVFL